jgi:transcriptional regulator with XRE-family HTH domain
MLNMNDRFIRVNGSEIKRLRRLSALSLRELGRRSGTAYDTINKLENEQRAAQARTLRRLADALGVEPRELMKGEE